MDKTPQLKDWLMDLETTTDILTESHTCLAEAKSCSLTHTLIHEALQAGKLAQGNTLVEAL